MATGFGLGGWAHPTGGLGCFKQARQPGCATPWDGLAGGPVPHSSAGVAKGAGRPCAKGVAAAASRVPTGVARWCGKGGVASGCALGHWCGRQPCGADAPNADCRKGS